MPCRDANFEEAILTEMVVAITMIQVAPPTLGSHPQGSQGTYRHQSSPLPRSCWPLRIHGPPGLLPSLPPLSPGLLSPGAGQGAVPKEGAMGGHGGTPWVPKEGATTPTGPCPQPPPNNPHLHGHRPQHCHEPVCPHGSVPPALP